MNWNVDHLPAFVAVADHGGISAAARHLAAPKSTVSRAVARLEEDVGLQLFVRGSKSLRLTHDGSQFYQHAIRILEQVDAASAELAGLSESPRGRLTVALPMAFGREIVGPHLTSFRAANPEITKLQKKYIFWRRQKHDQKKTQNSSLNGHPARTTYGPI